MIEEIETKDQVGEETEMKKEISIGTGAILEETKRTILEGTKTMVIIAVKEMANRTEILNMIVRGIRTIGKITMNWTI